MNSVNYDNGQKAYYTCTLFWFTLASFGANSSCSGLLASTATGFLVVHFTTTGNPVMRSLKEVIINPELTTIILASKYCFKVYSTS